LESERTTNIYLKKLIGITNLASRRGNRLNLSCHEYTVRIFTLIDLLKNTNTAGPDQALSKSRCMHTAHTRGHGQSDELQSRAVPPHDAIIEWGRIQPPASIAAAAAASDTGSIGTRHGRRRVTCRAQSHRTTTPHGARARALIIWRSSSSSIVA
jgi:hypothetical protein